MEMFFPLSSGNKDRTITIGNLKTIKLKESYQLKYYYFLFYCALTILSNVNDKIFLPAGKRLLTVSSAWICPCVGVCPGFNQGTSFSRWSYSISSQGLTLPSICWPPSALPTSPFLPSPTMSAYLTPLLGYINRASQTKHVQNGRFQTFSPFWLFPSAFSLISVSSISTLLISWTNMVIIFCSS